jgi:hypothetical protein
MSPLYLWEGTLLVEDGKLAAHEDCCCGAGADCDCCTGSVAGWSYTIAGVGHNCPDGNCEELNVTYCVAASSSDSIFLDCHGSLTLDITYCDKVSGVTAPYFWTNWRITDNGDGTCRLHIEVYTVGPETIRGYLDFTKGDACSTITGPMTTYTVRQNGTYCDFSTATITSNGPCTP